ncbi:MAG: hemerythrin domain-containing protein [Acidimicrobiia bacterium]
MTMMQGKPGASGDAIGLLTGQHREMEQIWTQLQAAHASGSDVQNELAQQIITLLSQHDAIETQFLYPELRGLGDAQGEQLADHSLDEHQQVRELLSSVDGEDVRDESVYSTLSRCIADVMAHVAEEEQQIFPLLVGISTPERLNELGQEMTAALKMAPTHPHPTTPNNKAGATVAGAVTGLVDKARDALRDAGRS